MKHTSEPYVLSLDVGTSSIRGKIYDCEGMPIKPGHVQVEYSMECTPDGGAYIELDTIMSLVHRVLDQAHEEIKAHSIPIAGVSCCTFWHNVVGVKKDGSAATSLLNWSDTRPEIVLPELKERLEPDSFTRRTGCPMHASYLPAKISWMRQARPETKTDAAYWMSIGECILYSLTGERRCSFSMASASGLLNSSQCAWDAETLEAIELAPEKLSPLCDAAEGVRGLRSPFQSRWPALNDAVWFPALGDGACSNIGCGCASPGRFALMVGTSGAMRVVWKGDYQQPPPGLWCYRIDKNRPVQGGALSNGGNVFAWLAKSVQLPESQEMEIALATLPPDSHGLTVLPFFSGQRSPRWNPYQTATIHGMRLSTKPIEILQASLESIAMRFRLIHDRLSENVPGEHFIVATGGGLLHSPAWIQIMADVIGHTVQVSNVTEASCRGAALVALESLGAINDIQDADAGLAQSFEPRDYATSIYRSAIKRHLEFESLLNQTAALRSESKQVSCQ